jgi:hypothetical protein
MIEAAEELGKNTGVSKACQVLGVPRSSQYWACQPKRAPALYTTGELDAAMKSRSLSVLFFRCRG